MPDLPLLSSDPTVIAVADVIRTLMLIAGFGVAGVAVHSIVALGRGRQGGAAVLRGFRWRSVALTIGTLYVCLNAYDRVGKSVDVQFPVGIVYLAVALYSTHLAVSHPTPPSDAEARLAEWEPPQRRPSD